MIRPHPGWDRTRDPGARAILRAMRAIPLARTARRRHRLVPPLIARDGTLDAGDTLAARRIAARLTADRATRSEMPVGAGEVTALAALDAVLHRVVERERMSGRANLDLVADRVRSSLGERAMTRVSRAWAREFGGRATLTAGAPTTAPRGAAAPGGVTEPDLTAEVLVLAALNENAAARPVRELVDDGPLRSASPYEAFIEAAERELGGRTEPSSDRPPGGTRGRPRRTRGGGRTGEPSLPLPARLREPMRHAPGSLAEQLRWVRDHWPELLADDPSLSQRITLALDVLAEEARGLELRAARTPFGGGIPAEAPDYRGLDAEPEAFSHDTEWMPSVVLLAKSSHVWLEQLARTYGRPVATLADVPDEELDRIAGLGISGLWLIGLWQRSAASAEIKRRRGDAEALASAYAIDEYRIADDLGGERAFATLRERAGGRGIRMAADMVPNHMGIDSRWLLEHPDRFISVDEAPFPAYSFGGPDLSPIPAVEITLEDHYWDGTDAAVVFRRRDRGSGETRFVYHGNDGTSFPWNDTAQLDYLRADVREAVIQTILDVARRAPIIRFDAAMVLAKRHIRRLWYPEPGQGGAIPSRAEHAMSRAAFDRAMPREFWREVVDRIATDAPGTLLMAEAFWLLEGYFVRTLGMHRVYNSAFMHMLREEDNAGYHTVLRETLEFDPGILQRFVNFMTNPDERPAAEQFGTGDKAFAVATLLATLPGLPMLGHGQVEGFRERYGMEFRQARWWEPLDEGHVGRFEREIVPLLRRRGAFSGVGHFRLYDAQSDDGSTVDDVYAYSNGGGPSATLVLVHNRYAEVTVRVDRSVGAAFDRSDGRHRLSRTRLAAALELPSDDAARIRLRDARSGWETVSSAGELRREGLRLTLGPYQALVLTLEPEVVAAVVVEPVEVKSRAAGRQTPNGAKAQPDLRTNPNALPDAEPPRIGRHPVNGTSLYAEVRGSGPAVLLVHAGGEDAEQWRPVAERLIGFTVVTYDRRGTLRSGRDAWPGGGSAQHADDAAGLLGVLGLDDVLVFGASSGGIPALQLALRHPKLIQRALVYEPGYFRQVPGGEAIQLPANHAVADYLAAHPGDWVGAYAAFRRAAGPPPGSGPSGTFAPPPGKEWYAEREDADAEALLVDDVPILSREIVDEEELAAAPVDIRFSFGRASLPIFQEIATHLATVRGAAPEAIEGAGHLMKYLPDVVAGYIRSRAG